MVDTKTMAGEPEIAVVPDHPLRFFMGPRTIMRFRCGRVIKENFCSFVLFSCPLPMRTVLFTVLAFLP